MNGVLVQRTARRSCVCALVFGAAVLVDASARADDDPPPARNDYFYHGYDYGSQSLHNPIYQTFARAYDTTQLRSDHSFGQVKMSDVQNVLTNFFDPWGPVSRDPGPPGHGWGTWLREEIFPLTFTQKTARWVPNYTLHLMGGGETYAEMREWFLQHDAGKPLATIMAVVGTYVAAIINESLENKGVVGDNTDCIADMGVFDWAGIMLFSFDVVRKFFSETVTLSDWSLQPAITFPHGDLQNVGNYYSLKVPLPFQKRVKAFAYGGYETLGGVSIKLGHELSLSVAAGERVVTFANAGGGFNVQNYVELRPAAAVFLDRNESLLASVNVTNTKDYALNINVYPNAFWHTDPGIGGWTAIGNDGKWLAGLSFTRTFGLGIGLGTR